MRDVHVPRPHTRWRSFCGTPDINTCEMGTNGGRDPPSQEGRGPLLTGDEERGGEMDTEGRPLLPGDKLRWGRRQDS